MKIKIIEKILCTYPILRKELIKKGTLTQRKERIIYKKSVKKKILYTMRLIFIKIFI